jgi:hypothetical protein
MKQEGWNLEGGRPSQFGGDMKTLQELIRERKSASSQIRELAREIHWLDSQIKDVRSYYTSQDAVIRRPELFTSSQRLVAAKTWLRSRNLRLL